MTIDIPFRLPSLNEYINECRVNRFKAAKMKKDIESQLFPYIIRLPMYENPVRIEFVWLESNKKRDCDNVSFGKKFILDAMVKFNRLPNDNPKYIKGFTDTFEYGDRAGVIVSVEEI